MEKGLMRWLNIFSRNKWLLLMVLPGTVWFFLFCYLPMPGVIIAFKDYKFDTDGFLASMIRSEWVGFKNFEYLFQTEDAWIIVRNTLLYNAVFILLGTFFFGAGRHFGQRDHKQEDGKIVSDGHVPAAFFILGYRQLLRFQFFKRR